MEREHLREIGRRFGVDCEFTPFGSGHINDTCRSDDGLWVLQRINTDVFTRPAEVMQNIEKVTEHIRAKLRAEGKDAKRGTLQIRKTTDGALFYLDESGAYRLYDYIEGTHSVDADERSMEQFEKAAGAFGEFQRMLSDFPAGVLYETIPDFHHTPKRLRTLRDLVRKLLKEEQEKSGEEERFVRLHEALPYVEYAFSQDKLAPIVIRGLSDGSIPLAVTHNDTKINNVLFDNETDEAVSVVDLDTVMPGSRLYDFGDAIRSGAVTAAEDEQDLSKVHFDPEAYQAFKAGYLDKMADALSEAERKLLFRSAHLMTYECGIRFLTDYLQEDIYFKTRYREHNLHRARNHFRLLREMLEFPADF